MAIAGTGKKISLELGGKSPVVVYHNADLDSAGNLNYTVNILYGNYFLFWPLIDKVVQGGGEDKK